MRDSWRPSDMIRGMSPGRSSAHSRNRAIAPTGKGTQRMRRPPPPGQGVGVPAIVACTGNDNVVAAAAALLLCGYAAVARNTTLQLCALRRCSCAAALHHAILLHRALLCSGHYGRHNYRHGWLCKAMCPLSLYVPTWFRAGSYRGARHRSLGRPDLGLLPALTA